MLRLASDERAEKFAPVWVGSQGPPARLSQQNEKFLFQQSRKFLFETGKLAG